MTEEELEKKAKGFELSKHYRYEDNDIVEILQMVLYKHILQV